MAEHKNLFQVYLRLRPPPPPPPNNSSQNPGYPTLPAAERFLTVEEPTDGSEPTHITLNPPNDNRRRAVEKFAFTKVFEEEAGQMDVFEGSGVVPLVEGVLGGGSGRGEGGRDGLCATLGVTGSGKSHTILGSKTQRGITQLALDLLFRSIKYGIQDPNQVPGLHNSIALSDASDAQVLTSGIFLENMFGDSNTGPSRASSRAPTPMVVWNPISLSAFNSTSPSPRKYTEKSSKPKISLEPHQKIPGSFSPPMLGIRGEEDDAEKVRSPMTETDVPEIRVQIPSSEYIPDSNSDSSEPYSGPPSLFPPPPLSSPYIPSYMQTTFTKAYKIFAKPPLKGESYTPAPPNRRLLQRPSALPQLPDLGGMAVETDPNAEYVVLISMYEVYNDRIFDLLTPASALSGTGKNPKDFRRRPLLFKSTELSPDRKVVAGLRKVICASNREALLVLEAGLHERRVAGTGSNSVSSRSHGFFCVEVKKRRRERGRAGAGGAWTGTQLTIVDLAGSERARDAKTQGATLAEAGKINESLMYLGQCLSMQSDLGGGTKPNLVPFRQCKLTELLFSNSFPNLSTASHSTHHNAPPHRNPQKAIMIVTADPLGDFNATSQILRYSALAREVTVPRIPSVTSTILAQAATSHYRREYGGECGGGGGGGGGERRTPTDTERETMEIAAMEIARMSEEIDGLRAELASEQQRRLETEAHLESLQDKVLEMEEEVRDEVYGEMEARMREEMRRWKTVWSEELERNDLHVDRKLEIYTRSIDAVGVGEAEGEDKENVAPVSSNLNLNLECHVDDLETENERLRREVEVLRREMQSRSPTRGGRLPLRESRVMGGGGEGREGSPALVPVGNPRLGIREKGAVSKPELGLGLGRGMLKLEKGMRDLRVEGDGDADAEGRGSVGSVGSVSPKKKMRKLVARKWDWEGEEDF